MNNLRRLKAAVAGATSSAEGFKRFAYTKDAPLHSGPAWYNEDLLPTPPEKRVWGTLHYFAFFLTTTFSPNSYNLGATLVSLGLLWWHGIIAAVIGSIILSVLVILNSRGASVYHIGFPVYVRMCAGMWGASLFIIVRAIVAILYFSIQSYYAGRLMSVMLYCIFGRSWQDLPNHLPESAGITSRDLLAFFIFWLIQLPVMFIHPTIIRHLYVIKSVYTTVSLFAVLGWAIHKNGGIGNLDGLGTTHATGATLAWGIISAVNSVMGALCPFLVNQPDIARYAKRPSDATWAQALGIMISKVLVMFLGCATTAATAGMLGTAYWNVWDLYTAILEKFWSPGARAGMFFASFGMVLAVLATNTGTNSLPVGADTAALAPRWLNIIRGQVLCALIAPLIVPWKIIANATSFLTFLGSYTVFVAPIFAIMIYDYWINRKGNIHILSLYDGTPSSIYWYRKGWNPCAVIAWACGVGFVIHGIAGALDENAVSQASKNMYKLGFILSSLMAAVLFAIMSKIWPVEVFPPNHVDEPVTFEALAVAEGFFPGEVLEDITGNVLVGRDVGNAGLSDVYTERDEKTVEVV